MMTTNEERRDIAEGLRNLAGKYVTLGELERVLGIDMTSPDVDIDRDAKDLNRLADLIEPETERTCRNIGKDEQGYWHDFLCSECGEVYDESDDMSYPTERIKYCPKCGAKVVE